MIKFRNLCQIPPCRLTAAVRNADASDVDDGLVGQLLLRRDIVGGIDGLQFHARIKLKGRKEGLSPFRLPMGKPKIAAHFFASNYFFEGGFGVFEFDSF